MVLSISTPENPVFTDSLSAKTVAFGKELTNQTWPDRTCSDLPLPSAHENLRLNLRPLASTSQQMKDYEGLNKTNLTKGNSKDGNEKGHKVRTGTEAQ